MNASFNKVDFEIIIELKYGSWETMLGTIWPRNNFVYQKLQI